MKTFLYYILLLPLILAAYAGDTEEWSMGPLGGTFQITVNSNMLKVMTAPAGTPAASGGLFAGDRIYGAFGEDFNTLNGYYVGSVQDFGSAIDRAEANGGSLPLKVLRGGVGAVTVNVTLPAVGAFGPAYPLGSPKFDTLYETSCAELHTSIMASSGSLLAYNNGWAGLTLLSHPNWNSTSGAKPYRTSINKLRDRVVSYLDTIILSPVEEADPAYVNPGLENWEIGTSTMFLAEYITKTSDTSVSATLQRACDALANRVQNYDTYPGHMAHGGVVGDYGNWALNIINVHTHAAFAMAKRAGATINQTKWDLSWNVLKQSTARSTGHEEDGYVDYGPPAWGQGSGWDASARTPGTIFGFYNYGQSPTTDDTDALNRMKGYVARKYERMQIAHAYTVGGVCFTQLSLPYLDDRSQRFIMDNNRFFYQFHRTNTTALQYFGGRGNNGGDSYLNFDTVKLYNAAFAKAVVSGNLPSIPALNQNRIYAYMKSPWTRWPTMTAKTAKLVGLSQSLDVDITDWQGTALSSGYTVAWSHVSGPGTATFTTPNAADTNVNFPTVGTYRLQLIATKGAESVTELYDFEVVTTTPTIIAPSITQQPVSTTVSPGGAATFSVTTTGTGPFLYEWKLDGVSYWGQSSDPTLTVPNAGAGAVGSYTCVVTAPGGSVTSSSATLSLNTLSVVRAGGLLRETWYNTSDYSITSLTSLLTYPRFPDASSIATTAETAENSGDNYGEKLSGWIIPPVTGSYRFYLSADDTAQFWLSTDATAANKVKRAELFSYTNFRTYNASSSAITLTAGQKYYVEILHVEGGGGDHLSLAWQLPGGAAPTTGSAPIDGQYLEYTRNIPLPTDHWRLDETSGTTAVNRIRSLHGTHQNGSLVNQTGANTATVKGVYYDGTNDRTQIAAPNYNTNAITFTAWVKRNGSVYPWAPFIYSRAGNTTAGFGVGDANELRYTWNGGGYTWAPSPALVLPDNEWCLVAMSVSPTGTSLYMRTPTGMQSATDTTTMYAEEFDGTMYLGWDPVNSSRYFKGSLDDVRVYKSSLNETDIEGLYQQAVSQPAVLITAPTAGQNVPQTNVSYSASVTGGSGISNSIEYFENTTSLGIATVSPFTYVKSSIAQGNHSVYGRLSYGEWEYTVDSPVVNYVAGPALPIITITASGSPQEEGVQIGTYQVSRNQTVGDLTVQLSISGTATNGSDYVTLPATVTIPNGQSSVNITLIPINDVIDDPLETVVLSIAANAAYNIGTPSSASLSIIDADGPQTIGAPWTEQAVGSTGSNNSASVTYGTGDGGTDLYSVTGGGSLTNNVSTDGFYFISMPVIGDCEITARVVSNGTSSTNMRAGVMIRETSANNSLFSSMVLRGTTTTTQSWSIYRSSAGANSGRTTGSSVAAPYWVRLLRNGYSFIASVSPDGTNWTQVATQTIAMNRSALVGLCVASGSTTTTNTATFDHVVVKRNIVSVNAPLMDAAEGNPVSAQTFTISRDVNAPPTALSVNVNLSGTATVGSDYNLSGATLSGNVATVNFPAGVTSVNVVMTPLNDLINESLESVIFTVPTSTTDYMQGSPVVGSTNIVNASVSALTVSASPAIGGNATGGGTYYTFSSPTITATAAANYVFVNWSGTGIADANSPTTTVLLDQAKTVTANFVPINHALTVNAGTGGTATGSGTFQQGSNPTITATASANYVFVNWSGVGIADVNSATTTVLLDQAKTVTANFAPINHALTVNAGTGGTATGSGTFQQGSNPTITATASANYVFVNWSGVGIADVNNPATTVLLDQAKTVTANFALLDPYPAWIASFGVTGADANKEADPDRDGTPNIAEMHLGFDPTDSNSHLQMSINQVGATQLTLRINKVVTVGQFVLESSDTLQGAWAVESTLAISETATNYEVLANRHGLRHFYRLRYAPPPFP